MKKPTTRQGQIEHILNQLSHAQLKTFMLERALHDADFRDTLLICFSDLLSSDEPSEPKYRQMLADITQRHVTAEGYISPPHAQLLSDSIKKLLDVARKATTPTRETTDLCLAVISTLPKLAEQMDDSEGHIHNLMRSACTILWECSISLAYERQQALFGRILEEYAKPIYLDLDLDSTLLSLLKDWAKNNPARQTACLRQLEVLLKTTQTQDDKWRKNYLLEQTKALLAYWKR